MMRIVGSEDVPCKAGEATVPEIEYNLATGKIKFKLSSVPGVFAVPTGVGGK